MNFNVVREHVARNPIARAIAIRSLASKVRDFQIQVYSLRDGEQIDFRPAAMLLTVAAQIDPHLEIEAGLTALVAMSQEEFRWRRAHAWEVDQALHVAMQIYEQADAQALQRAYAKVSSA